MRRGGRAIPASFVVDIGASSVPPLANASGFFRPRHKSIASENRRLWRRWCNVAAGKDVMDVQYDATGCEDDG